MSEPEEGANRWRARPIVAAFVTGAVFAVPVGCSVGTAALVGHLWPVAATGLGTGLRWTAILGASSVVLVVCERLTRRALPLTVLLKMAMVFPGRAPRRLSVARRSFTTRDLSRRIDEARHHGVADEPTMAAEKIVALAATLSAHDRRTRGHAERVRAFTDLIAEELHLPDDDRDRLRWSALLHDVGKLTVHSDILNKAGALTDEEWELMRNHPLEGAKLTAPLAPWLGPWARTIAEHHERYDGRGYPAALTGAEISTGGRIVAVADSYDTMTSLRSYKKPMSAEAARTELAACAGAQFDPVIVRAFLNISVSRLHAVAPLTWLGSLPVGNVGPGLARAATLGGRIAVTGVAAAGGVVGLTLARATPDPAASAAVTASRPEAAAVSRPGSTPVAGGAAAGDAAASGTAHRSGGAGGSDGSGGSGRGGRSGPGGGSGAGSSSGSGAGGVPGPGGGSGPSGGPGAGTDGSGVTTTVASGSGSGPTTTVASGPGTTTTTATTTTTTLPPLLAPGNLAAAASCQALVLEPEVTLTWTASPTTRVTGYVVLRSSSRSGSYGTIASVSGRTTVTYVDTTANGLGTTYFYEVEATAGGSLSAPTAPVSATTGTLCL